MLLEDGKLEEADGAYRPIGDLGTLQVPDTLHALIAARLDARRPRRQVAAPGRLRPRPVVHRGRPRGADRRAGRRARGAAALAGAPRDPPPRHGPAVAGAGPVRLHAGARPRGRLLHPGEAGPADEAPRRGALLRVARGRGGGRGPRDALHRRLRGQPRRCRGRGRRRPGPDRAPRRGRPRHGPRRPRKRDRPLGAGPVGHGRRRRPGRPPGEDRPRQPEPRPFRRRRDGLPRRPGAVPCARRPRRRGACLVRPWSCARIGRQAARGDADRRGRGRRHRGPRAPPRARRPVARVGLGPQPARRPGGGARPVRPGACRRGAAALAGPRDGRHASQGRHLLAHRPADRGAGARGVGAPPGRAGGRGTADGEGSVRPVPRAVRRGSARGGRGRPAHRGAVPAQRPGATAARRR